jgi:hypothetical protein
MDGIIDLKRDLFALIGDPANGYFIDRKEGHRLPIPNVAPVDSEVAQRLTTIFVSNLDEPGSAPRSLDYFGCPYLVIGKEIVEWGFQKRLKAIAAHLEEVGTEYLMVLDSDDVFAVDSLATVVDRFEKRFECDMLMNAAQNFWPPELEDDPGLRKFCESTPSVGGPEHKFVNGGLWIARTEFYRGIVDEVMSTRPARDGCDQSVFYQVYRNHYPAIQMDYRCEIFQCEFDEELEWEAGPRAPWLRGLTERLPEGVQRGVRLKRTKRGRRGGLPIAE